MRHHKYLEELGYSPDCCSIPDNTPFDKKYSKKKKAVLKEQRKKYGFSDNEVWNMDMSAAMWLYEHLLVYRKRTIADMNYYYFNIPVLVLNEQYEKEKEEAEKKISAGEEYSDLTRDGTVFFPRHYKMACKKHTQGEAIDICIAYLRDYLSYYADPFKDEPKKDPYEWTKEELKMSMYREDMAIEKMQDAFRIYAEIAPATWW